VNTAFNLCIFGKLGGEWNFRFAKDTSPADDSLKICTDAAGEGSRHDGYC
jgi:hypothetical protein